MRKKMRVILLAAALILGGVGVSAAQLLSRPNQMGPCHVHCKSDLDCAFSPDCPNCLSTTFCGNAP